MSRAKFASVTSDLLARKGDATPWQPVLAAPLRSTAQRAAAAAPQDALEAALDHAPHWPEALHEHHPGLAYSKRYVLKLTPSEYERLGIVAVKKNLSRQQIVRYALEEYLADAAREFGGTCGCLADHACGACPGSDETS